MNIDSYFYFPIHQVCLKLGVTEFTCNVGGTITSLDIRYLNSIYVYM